MPRFAARAARHRGSAVPTVLALVLVLTGCGPGAGEPGSTTTTVATTTTATILPVPTTTSPTSTTLPPSTTTTTSADIPSERSLLVASIEGIAIVDAGGGRRVLLDERPVAVAVPDLMGGVVFQEATPDGGAWPPIFPPIEWIREPGDEPEVIVPMDDVYRLILLQVIPIDGAPTMLYRRLVIEDEDDQTETLVAYDLTSGEERTLGILGGYETSWTDVRVGGSWVALTWEGYGDEFGCSGSFPLADLVSGSPDAWVRDLCDETCCTFGTGLGCAWDSPCATLVPGEGMRSAVTPDDELLVIAVNRGPGSIDAPPAVPTVYLLDRASGSVIDEIEVPLSGSQWIVSVEARDDSILLNTRSGAISAYLLIRDGVIVDADGAPGVASFWDEPSSPLPVLRGDGFGAIDFGTPMDEAMAYLTDLLGEPTDDFIASGPWDEASGSDSCAMQFGLPCVDLMRWVRWGDIEFGATFLDGPGYRDDGVVYFAAWGVGGPRLVTDRGIGVGSTYLDLQAAYGAVEAGTESCGEQLVFAVDGIRGVLSALLAHPLARIASLGAGVMSSC